MISIGLPLDFLWRELQLRDLELLIMHDVVSSLRTCNFFAKFLTFVVREDLNGCSTQDKQKSRKQIQSTNTQDTWSTIDQSAGIDHYNLQQQVLRCIWADLVTPKSWNARYYTTVQLKSMASKYTSMKYNYIHEINSQFLRTIPPNYWLPQIKLVHLISNPIFIRKISDMV